MWFLASCCLLLTCSCVASGGDHCVVCWGDHCAVGTTTTVLGNHCVFGGGDCWGDQYVFCTCVGETTLMG